MRIRKSLLLVLLLSFGLTGCYTQLEYSQKMKKVTDDRSNPEYSWSDDSDEKANLTEADSIYIAETYGAKVAPYREEDGGAGEYANYEDEEYIPVHYKDYDVVETYEACGCNPYKTYVIYDSYYPSSLYHGYGYSYNRFHHWPSYYAFGSPYYHWRSHFSFGYFHRGFGLAFHWGHPYSFYDPFFYDPFYYGYSSPIFYNNYYYGSGYAGTIRTSESDRRYGRRSIGADRVRDGNSSSVRTRSALNRDREKANTNTVRTRTTGVQRTRGTIDRTRNTHTRTRGTGSVGSSSRSRSGSGNSGTSVKRSRGNDNGSSVRSRSGTKVKRDRDNSRERVSDSRSALGVSRGILLPARTNRAQIESNIRKQRVESPQNNQQRTRRSFFGRFKSVFDMDRSFNSSRTNSSSRSFTFPSNNRSKVGNNRSSRSSSRSTSVKRSRSSSKSSGSRSRGSSGGSSSKRDRGNN